MRCNRLCSMNDPDKGCLLGGVDMCRIGPEQEYHQATEAKSGSVREKLVELLTQNELEFMTYRTNKLIDAAIGDDPLESVLSRAAFTAGFLLANGVTVQEWIPVTERLPESEKCVLVYSKDGGVAEGKYNAQFKKWTQFRWNVTELRNVTHWMPLPTPPKGE